MKLIDSTELSRLISMKHDKILRRIEGGKETIGLISKINPCHIEKYFILSNYKDSRNRTYKSYKLTYAGVDFFIQNCRKSPRLKGVIDYLNKANYKSTEIILSNRFEDEFGDSLKEVLNQMNIDIEKQKSVYSGKYKIDFYIPKYNMAIEYDEYQHKYNKENDKIRESEIHKKLNCSFIRLDSMKSDNSNIGIVINELLKLNI